MSIRSFLPFGLRSAPIIFNVVANGLEFTIRKNGVNEVGHCQDDFVVLGPPVTSI